MAPQMAPSTDPSDRPSSESPTSGPREVASPTPADIGVAVVHFAHLAAARAGLGVELLAGDDAGVNAFPTDKESLAILANVTGILLAHRAKMAMRAADVAISQLHDDAANVFDLVQKAPEDVEGTSEELMADHAQDRGFELGPAQTKRFAVDRAHIKEHQGPVNAAADALVDAMHGQVRETQRGRNVFNVKNRRRTRPPVAAPFHRYVCFRDVGRYFNTQLAAAAQTVPTVLSLEALSSAKQNVEPLLEQNNAAFRKQMRADLSGAAVEEVTKCFAYLLHGDPPGPGFMITSEMEQMRIRVSEMVRAWPVPPDPRALALAWIADLRSQLGVEE